MRDASGSVQNYLVKTSLSTMMVVFRKHLLFMRYLSRVLTNHFQKTATGMMVFLVVLQVFCQIADAFRKNGESDSGIPCQLR